MSLKSSNGLEQLCLLPITNLTPFEGKHETVADLNLCSGPSVII